MAIGDGSNDLAMLTGAGLGIGYYPKPLVIENVPNCILHGDLTAALYAQGYSGF
jgi:phosphoserine phosphatase